MPKPQYLGTLELIDAAADAADAHDELDDQIRALLELVDVEVEA